MKQRWGIVQFLGSNCDWDAYHVFEKIPGVYAQMHWYNKPIEPGDYDVILIPGGFSFGDYLRAGAIAKISPALSKLQECAQEGAHILGICNGFQVLLELKLLPGILKANESLSFVHQNSLCKIQEEALPWIRKEDIGKELLLPIAHGFGNYQVSQVSRADAASFISYVENPNGSSRSTAGIHRKEGKGSITALMPHPERASNDLLGLSDGSLFWKNAVEVISQ